MDPKIKSELEKLFRSVDKDHNGHIDKSEFENLVNLIGAGKLSASEKKKLFGLIDVNADGKIDLKEFLKGIESM